MLEKFLGGDSKIAILLEAVIQEVLYNRRSTIRYWRAIILNNAKQGGHGIEEVVRRFSLEKLDDGASYTPKINERG